MWWWWWRVRARSGHSRQATSPSLPHHSFQPSLLPHATTHHTTHTDFTSSPLQAPPSFTAPRGGVSLFLQVVVGVWWQCGMCVVVCVGEWSGGGGGWGQVGVGVGTEGDACPGGGCLLHLGGERETRHKHASCSACCLCPLHHCHHHLFSTQSSHPPHTNVQLPTNCLPTVSPPKVHPPTSSPPPVLHPTKRAKSNKGR